MPDPTSSQGHYDLVLTNLSVSYAQQAEGFVADKVFPVVPVKLASSFYYSFPRGAFFRDDVGPRPIGGYPRQVGYNLTKLSYLAEEEALEAWLDDRERANYTAPSDPERNKIRLLTSQHLIHRDRRFATSYLGTGIWGTDVTGVAAGPTGNQVVKWSVSTSTPVEDILLWSDTLGLTGYRPNRLILGTKTFRTLQRHTEVIEAIKYTGEGVRRQVTPQALADLFGVDQVLVPRSVVNTAAEGDAESLAYITPQDIALLCYTADSPSLDTPSAGYIFAWTGLLGPNAFDLINVVTRGRDDRAYSDWFHVRTAYDMHVVAPDLGVFFTTVV